MMTSLDILVAPPRVCLPEFFFQMIAMTTSSVISEAVRMAMVTTTPMTVGRKVCPLSTPKTVSVVDCVLLGAMIMMVSVVGCSGLASSAGVGGSGIVGSIVGGSVGMDGGWVSGVV